MSLQTMLQHLPPLIQMIPWGYILVDLHIVHVYTHAYPGLQPRDLKFQ